MRLNFDLTEDQARFVDLPHKYRAFIGGFGTGKTETLIASALIDSLASSKAVVGIYSPTYDLLKLTIEPRICSKLDSLGIRYKFNKSDHVIYTSNRGIGDFIMRSLDTPERIIGYETFSSHIDELDTLHTEHAEHAFRQIEARNRQNIGDRSNRIGVYSTPEGFKFCYKKFYVEGREERNRDLFGMVQASSRSNPFLPSGYIEGIMNNYPEALRDAYIDGKFVNLLSGTVYKTFDQNRHHCETVLTDDDLELFIGMDFNINHMSAAVVVKRGSEYHAVDEIVDAFDTAEICQIISNRYAKPGRTIKIFPDATGHNRHSSAGALTDHQILRNAGFKVYTDGVNPRIKDRINIVNAAFCNGNGVIRLKVNTTKCKRLTECLIQQSYDKNGEPDKKSGFDHLNDSFGYAIVQLIPFTSPNVRKLINF